MSGISLREYLSLEEWQISELQRAAHEADAGDFTSEDEVQAVMGKWTKNALSVAESCIEKTG